MTKRLYLATALFLGFFALAATSPFQSSYNSSADFSNIDETPVSTLEQAFGEKPLHEVKNVKGASAEKGRELVFTGMTTDPKGRQTEKQSQYFVCASCHNPVKDHPFPDNTNAEAKLEYSAKNNIPLLPANSFYGMVNRTTFYNDDYQKKYGHVKTINKAKDDIREAIQVCATECSQGRALEKWEIESILAFLHTLELKVGDLDLSAEDKQLIQTAFETKTSTGAALALLQSKFLRAYPAHFVEPPTFQKLSNTLLMDSERYRKGKLLYDLSCKHCHSDKRYASMVFNDKQEGFKKLKASLESNDPHSIIMAIRKGIPANAEKNTSYMPQYTKEHLSNDMLLDLRIYIENNAIFGSEKDLANFDAACNSSTNYQDVKTILDEKCVNCHNSYLAPDFTSYESMRGSLERGSFDMRVFVRKDMPIGIELSEEELHLLLCWKNNGYAK